MTYLILFCALLATAVGQSVFLTVLPSLGREAGLTEWQVAVMMSSSAFVFAIGANCWSRVTVSYGYKRLLMVGLSGYTLGTFVFASLWWVGLTGFLGGTALFVILLLARSLQSSVMSATPPSAVGYVVAMSEQRHRASAISKVTSANNLGQVLGPPLAGVLVTFGLLTPLYSILALTIVALLLVWQKLPAFLPPAKSQTDASSPDVGPVSSSVKLFIIGCACLFLCMAMMQQSLAFFLMDENGVNTVQAAQLTGSAMMVSAVFSLMIQFGIVQRHLMRPETLICLAAPLLALAYLIIAIHQQTVMLYVAMGILGLGMGAAYPSLAALATMRCLPERQSRVTGMITATPAMGYIIGPPLSATAYHFDHRYPFMMAGVIMLVIATLLIFKIKSEG